MRMRSELADQQQRDQEGVVELQVEQQANLLEDRGIFEQLRLVDDDDGLAAVAVRLEDDFVNPVHEARAIHVGAIIVLPQPDSPEISAAPWRLDSV
ncbi:MAG: hypothetical protein VYD18_06255 [Candidatus Latescibacterota bacterium]|nr:hypothetical protein [Candidatus Latescibacterota bacterium]